MLKKGCLKKPLKALTLSKLAILTNIHFAYSFTHQATFEHGRNGFLPDNNLQFPADDKSSGLDQKSAEKIILSIQKEFKSDIEKRGGVLKMNLVWQDPSVNALASRNLENPKLYEVKILGGLARHPMMTSDTLALIACHELGHHIGGSPTKKAGASMMSVEGQADYFAGLRCLKRVFALEDNRDVLKKFPREIEAKAALEKCSLVYGNENELNVCLRIARASLEVGRLFQSLSKKGTRVSLLTRDTNVVDKIFEGHPAAQCRVDTLMSGALCDKDLLDQTSNKDENLGVCSQKNGDQIGLRPSCWFVPAA